MNVQIKRIYNCSRYCIGHIYIDGVYECDCIEDTDRMLDQSMSEDYIKSKKVYAQTAIPTGTYNILMNIVSPKFSLKPYYKKFCGGKVPRLDPVKGFVGILMHCGVNEKSSAGCIILGLNKIKGQVVDTQRCFESFYKKLQSAYKNNEKITCTISRNYK